MWAAATRPVAERLAADPEQRAAWLRCGGTWYAGVNALPNAVDGSVPEERVPPLAGAPMAFIAETLGLAGIALDAAQISICYPGYPRQGDDESDAVFRFRRDRDAAHVDGLLREPPSRQRRLGETHAFVLGIPLGDVAPDAAPLVVWEGSHEIMRRAFRARFDDVPPDDWASEDITDCYVAARRECFEVCRRVPVHVPSGGAYIVHRLALHGVAPWAGAETKPRAIAYFRPDPCFEASPAWWLELR